MRIRICLIATLLLLVGNVQPSKILGYLVSPGRSHFIVHDALMRGLAEKGHDVTVVGIWPPKQPMPATYRYIHLKMTPEETKFLDNSKQNLLINAENNTMDMMHLPRMMSKFNQILIRFLQSPEVQRLKREETFDLVAFGYLFNDFQMGLAGHFKCPSVVISSGPIFKPTRDLVANPSTVAYKQFLLFSDGKSRMTFLDRIGNYLFEIVESVVFTFIDYYVFFPHYETLFPSDKYPSLNEVRKNVSLVLVSSHVSQGNSPPTMPGIIEVSGIQIKAKPDPLPDNIKDFLDGAKNGAIFFSFGTNIDPSVMSEEKRSIILAALAKLKQRVLWKYDQGNLPNKPDNIMIGKWLPQDDILAHPNVQLFISHCGKGSVDEAMYHGVPILGMPMFGDQMNNLRIIVNEGWAVSVDFAKLTEQSLSEKLDEVLNNATYRNTVKAKSDLYRDRPQHPLDLAVFWTEYVLRHNGAKHLQSHAVHLNWFQLQSYDVLSVIFLTLYAVWRILKYGVLFVISLCCRRQNKFKKD